jgi:hypothetical protein
VKLYSNTLTLAQVRDAVPAGCNGETIGIRTPRVRTNGWTVRLTKPGGTHYTNTGTHGAGAEKAASWDDHGVWMARLYELDPEMRVAHYTSAEDFHEQTKEAYRVSSAA